MILNIFVFIVFFKILLLNNVKRMLLICVKSFTLRMRFDFDYRTFKSKRTQDESLRLNYFLSARCCSIFWCIGAYPDVDDGKLLSCLQSATPS
jgi:hypothetical protein